MTLPRLHVEGALASGLAAALGAEQAHYLRNVLRRAPGDEVVLFNGRDGEWLGRIAELGKAAARVDLVVQRRGQPPPGLDPWLVFAPVKRQHLDYLVEKATELGAGLLQPVTTRRTAVERVNLQRLAAHAIEAAEQCERLTVPSIRPPEPLDRLIAGWPAGRRLLLCDESGAAPPIAEVLHALPAAAGEGGLAVLTGPEGGFAETELDALRKLPFVCPVGLGPRVLRADTAALAALAIVQALAGDWTAARHRMMGTG